VENRYKDFLEGKIDVANAKELMIIIKNNTKVINTCIKHNFNIPLKQGHKSTRKYQCSECGGVIGSEQKYWYEKALEHIKLGCS